MDIKSLFKYLAIAGGFVISGAIAFSLLQIVNTNNALLAIEQQRIEKVEKEAIQKREAFDEDTTVCVLALKALSTNGYLPGVSERNFVKHLETQVRKLSDANSYSADGEYQDKKLDSLMVEAIDALAAQATAFWAWIITKEQGFNVEIPDATRKIAQAEKASNALVNYCKANY